MVQLLAVGNAELEPTDPLPVMIPAPMASKLQITPERVEAGEAEVSVNGRTAKVIGIFKEYAAVMEKAGRPYRYD